MHPYFSSQSHHDGETASFKAESSAKNGSPRLRRAIEKWGAPAAARTQALTVQP